MDWKSYYNSRKVTADEAVKHVKDGYNIAFSHATAEVRLLPHALVRRQNEIKDVGIFHGLNFGPGVYCQEDVDPDRIRHYGIFFGKGTRAAGARGQAALCPIHFGAFPGTIRDGLTPMDCAFLHVSPPDEFGYCTFGVSCDWERAAIDSAELVIAEVNPNMPRTFGDNLVHVSEIDYFVESNESVLNIGKTKAGPVEEAIGKNIGELIPDGACLQLGVGGIPDAIMEFLAHKNDLGLHSELIPEGTMPLIQAGNINNKKKKLHTGKSIVSFAGGSAEFYQWLHENRGVEFHPVDYVNDPRVIGNIDNMISVNAALQVDLMGQVNAEAINRNQFSGVGGQVDFVRGATWSKGGKSIIAMTSTTKGGTISRIVAGLQPGDPVTTARTDVDYIVTEHGVAHLRGKDLFERARLLIAIAHPNFRDQLKDEFKAVYGREISMTSHVIKPRHLK